MLDDPIASIVYIILELLIAVFSVLGNVLVCWAVALNSNLQNITNFFVVSLAVADIAVGVLAIPFSIAISTGFCSDFYGCLFIACFVMILTQSSIFSLLAIAMDRYIAIKLPLRYGSLVTGQRAKGIIAICWIFSIIIGLIPMMGWHKPISSEAKNCSRGLVKCMFENVMVMDYMVYLNFFACVLIPLLLMLAIYLCIFMVARQQLKLMEMKVLGGEKSRSTLQKEIQAAKSLAIIVGLFAVCWLPLHIINCFTLFCTDCDRPPLWVMNIAILLSHGNSVVNPFIYAYRIREFRRTFQRIIQRRILGRLEELDGASMATSTYNSVTDSVRLHTNHLTLDVFTERNGSSSSISCESSEQRCPVGSRLVAMSQAPLSVVICHCPAAVSLKPIRSSRLPDCQPPSHSGEESEGQNLRSSQLAMLFLNQKCCSSELVKVS
ncbi:adenosine A2a receptor a [Synchiropus splendidus]|uniref:adenosine A2a receptor a n=1 Tax=Synchiropus splendidus TaxID=270530 RepID=UPI00237DBD23|nr:adenosine A2a receptor a [Synchiropus splendidus]